MAEPSEIVNEEGKKLNHRYYFQKIVYKSLNRFFDCIGVDRFFLQRMFSTFDSEEMTIEAPNFTSAANSNHFLADFLAEDIKAQSLFTNQGARKRPIDEADTEREIHSYDLYDLIIELEDLKQRDERTQLVCKVCSGSLSYACQNYDCRNFYNRFLSRSSLMQTYNKLRLNFEK